MPRRREVQAKWHGGSQVALVYRQTGLCLLDVLELRVCDGTDAFPQPAQQAIENGEGSVGVWHGEQRRTCMKRGALSDDLRSTRVSWACKVLTAQATVRPFEVRVSGVQRLGEGLALPDSISRGRHGRSSWLPGRLWAAKPVINSYLFSLRTADHVASAPEELSK
jgi:hypothetical protein